MQSSGITNHRNSQLNPNKRFKSARGAHPTRNGEAPLLAGHSQR